MASTQFELSDPPSDAISAIKFAPNTPTRLLVASWDKHIYLYDTHAQPGGRLIRKYEHRAPVLDVCFGANEDEAFTAGLDWDVRRIDLNTGDQTVLSTHEAGVKSVVYSASTGLLISASWDSTLHIHFPARTPPEHPPATVPLPSKPFSISLTETKLVVAMASRALHIYDLRSLRLLASQSAATEETPGRSANELEAEPWQRRESSLKFMTRAVACMPNDAGYASSSIEGRVAVEWFDPSAESQARKYAFKCHRQHGTDGDDDVDLVYPVNALAFHPVHGTFASGGGDGFVTLWDAVAKRRIRQYQKFPSSVAALDFNCEGRYLAVAVSPGFEDGSEDVVGGVYAVFIRELGPMEAKGKGGSK
ncbi:hypothetical protein LTR28_010151 [Elasticomyces elasticus]|nr:hypothetical protein LTR28_010151 [Elasticomyces elasticus]